jgi:hypothetical protein
MGFCHTSRDQRPSRGQAIPVVLFRCSPAQTERPIFGDIFSTSDSVRTPLTRKPGGSCRPFGCRDWTAAADRADDRLRHDVIDDREITQIFLRVKVAERNTQTKPVEAGRFRNGA